MRNVEWRLVRAFAEDNFWVHTIIGIIGNSSFFIGTVLWKLDTAMDLALWLFIIGTGGMLIGSIGAAFARWERRVRRREKQESQRDVHVGEVSSSLWTSG